MASTDRVLMFVTLGLAVLGPPPAVAQTARTAPSTIVNCNMNSSGGGRQTQICTAGSGDIVPVGPEDGRPARALHDLDGSYVEQFLYRIPTALNFEGTFCAKDLVSVQPLSLSRNPLLWRRVAASPGCVAIRFSAFAGLLSVALRTRTPDSRIDLSFAESAPLPPPPPALTPPPVVILPPPPIF